MSLSTRHIKANQRSEPSKSTSSKGNTLTLTHDHQIHKDGVEGGWMVSLSKVQVRRVTVFRYFLLGGQSWNHAMSKFWLDTSLEDGKSIGCQIYRHWCRSIIQLRSNTNGIVNNRLESCKVPSFSKDFSGIFGSNVGDDKAIGHQMKLPKDVLNNLVNRRSGCKTRMKEWMIHGDKILGLGTVAFEFTGQAFIQGRTAELKITLYKPRAWTLDGGYKLLTLFG